MSKQVVEKTKFIPKFEFVVLNSDLKEIPVDEKSKLECWIAPHIPDNTDLLP